MVVEDLNAQEEGKSTSKIAWSYRRRHEDAIVVDPAEISGSDSGTQKGHHDVLLADAVLLALHGTGSQSSYPNGTLVDLVYIADAPKNHKPRPAVRLGQLCNVTSHKRGSQAAAAFDNEDSPIPRLLQRAANQNIVLEDLHSDYSPRKYAFLTKGL